MNQPGDYAVIETRTKVCTRCKTRKQIQQFVADARASDGRHCWCKLCRKASTSQAQTDYAVILARLAERRAREFAAAGLCSYSDVGRVTIGILSGQPASVKPPRAVGPITPAAGREHL